MQWSERNFEFEGHGSENHECSECGRALAPEDKEAGVCWDCQMDAYEDEELDNCAPGYTGTYH